MNVLKNIAYAVTAVALAVALVALGFAACILPPVTHGLSSMFAKDDISPFSRAQLVQVADATRDYSFGAHDETALYRAIYEVDAAFQKSLLDAGGTVPTDFPKIDRVNSTSSLTQLKSASEGASELYCYAPATVAHLDDCYKLAASAFPWIIVAAAVAFVGLAFAGVTGRKRRVGSIVFSAGIIVVVAFAALGIWAAVNFDSFFRTFHQLFFSQGNWEFPYDSLLICSLPTEFWMGMGVVWLLVTLFAAVFAIVFGRRLKR